ncbi:MAG: hypothetical protein O3C54_01460, partial [Proteobacteria bacterium]|nr:hypothetical protein [Pseudomonadota bacterium]
NVWEIQNYKNYTTPDKMSVIEKEMGYYVGVVSHRWLPRETIMSFVCIDILLVCVLCRCQNVDFLNLI